MTKKHWLILVSVIVGVFILGIIAFGIWTALVFDSFFDSDWAVEDQPWEVVTVPVEDYDGQVTYLVRHIHPFLAEYEYKIEVKNGLGSKEFDLPINTGGKLSEEVWLYECGSEFYLETRETVINIESLETEQEVVLQNCENRENLGIITYQEGKVVFESTNSTDLD